ncbi:MAG: phage resistance protein, partial [Sandaracinaceae bacterium]|nr:phage resistance protein [Sandaracinaceae bacterium]
HMIGKDSIESAIFKAYLDYLRVHHPAASVPGLFADEALFEDAAQMLRELGEEAFFAPMNEGVLADEGWGEIGAGSRWTAERFLDAVRSSEPSTRAELFSALTKTRFRAYLQQNAFIDLDTGLGVLARHAAGLGYDGVVLFLDELILWLAHRASEVSWMHNEVQKMVKLVEAQESHREIPIISFMARQRNLSEMVGEVQAGDENARLHESLKHWEGRFDSVLLEDRNLPAVVEKRVVKPKDAAARAQLDAAFEALRRGAGDSWETMLGKEDGQAFRQLYPFSPALVDALVALSNTLQRSRTAIRLLNELLVDHIEDLQVGEVVRVGDLFDVLAGGEDAADGVMKSRFESAKRLYEQDLLPVIRRSTAPARPSAASGCGPTTASPLAAPTARGARAGATTGC